MKLTSREYRLKIKGEPATWKVVGETPDSYGMKRLRHKIVAAEQGLWTNNIAARERRECLKKEFREFGYDIPIYILRRDVTNWEEVDKV